MVIDQWFGEVELTSSRRNVVGFNLETPYFRAKEEGTISMSQSDALVFFGATGDLDFKKIFPALQAMLKRGHFDVPGAAESLVEAFEELLTLHRVQVSPLLRKTLHPPTRSKVCSHWFATVSGTSSGRGGAACFSDGSARYCSLASGGSEE